MLTILCTMYLAMYILGTTFKFFLKTLTKNFKKVIADEVTLVQFYLDKVD